ncbi:hypothetical protein RvY_05273, partial [Ramazzottius varieornatus]
LEKIASGGGSCRIPADPFCSSEPTEPGRRRLARTGHFQVLPGQTNGLMHVERGTSLHRYYQGRVCVSSDRSTTLMSAAKLRRSTLCGVFARSLKRFTGPYNVQSA